MDFLAIGDTVIDDFIRLKDAEVHCDINSEHCTITMRWGDKIPFESSTVVYGVGNAANAAVAAARLRLKTSFISNVGADDRGEKIIAYFKDEKIDTSHITQHQGVPTNYHYVLWYGAERTILVKQNAYPYAFPDTLEKPRAVYFSSIGEGASEYREEVIRYLDKNSDVFFAFQPGVFEIKQGIKTFSAFYKRANVVTANKEEYQRILGTAEEDPKRLMTMMRAHGPKICFLTDGAHGAYALSDEGAWKISPYPDPKPPLDRTGAGDAFASTATIALLLGKSVSEALEWGPVNSMSVVQYVGAQKGLLSRKMLEDYLEMAPETYRAIPL